VILHPDETHDGAAGTDAGFAYRAIYLAPELVHEALDGAPLPFVAEPVHDPPRRLPALFREFDDPVGELARVEIAAAVADLLRTLGGSGDEVSAAIDNGAVEVARDYLAAHARERTPASTLEQLTGTDRFTLTRHFRRAFGTSPDRYRTLRRLELARSAIESGLPLARAAAYAGFADQSHMTRQFKSTYGLTPARWTELTAV
jgi:AraC-like DNA-binding protein